MNGGDRSMVKKGYKGKKKKSEQLLKVVYISSPMKVKTSASRFRSLVQELTGKNSDVSQYMDDGAKDFYHEIDCEHQSIASVSTDDNTPTSSDSLQGHMDLDAFTSQMRDQFSGIFSSDSFYDPSQLDVLGSFDELL
ncbi:sigma factor binding protein 1, chloroplastic-like [Salvia miltiorrhiza]|uniref:sigma factor binding protein 1, chloroplastic-like n=1 Tax=Salvia miltiorrhiza TaxID=226208 RepID=UPI0025AC08D5|nr:sigma factor binding protein 1, chloroplastic-like [Salvia miltiorrhiza]